MNDDNDKKPDNIESLLTFPTSFQIKIFGLANDEFEIAVLTIIRKHIANLAENAIQSRLSANGKYLALSITMEAESKAQLDAIYQDLSSCPQVLMAL